jgi:hypothetical protein
MHLFSVLVKNCEIQMLSNSNGNSKANKVVGYKL